MAFKAVTLTIEVDVLIKDNEEDKLSIEYIKNEYWEVIRENVWEDNYEIKSYEVGDEEFPE
jgi:hypothetical protein